MAATTNDLFGGTPGAEPAIPGSYGEAPSGFRLPAGTRLGRVRLQVADLGRSLTFYQHTLGLRILRRDSAGAVLAAHGDDRPLVDRTVLQAVSAPTLVIGQADDRLHPLALAREVAAAIPSAELLALPEGGVFWTCAAQAQAALAHHLEASA